MSDSLTIGSGSRKTVTITAMTSRTGELDALLLDAYSWSNRLVDARHLTPGVTGWVADALDTVNDTIVEIESGCDALARQLRTAAERYGEAEENARRWSSATNGSTGLVGAGWTELTRRGPHSGGGVAGILSSVVTVGLVRAMIESADETLLHTFGLSWLSALAFTASGSEAGAQHTTAAALWLATMASLPFARSGPTSSRRWTEHAEAVPGPPVPASAPQGFADLGQNMPTSTVGEGAQIGVQRIDDEYVVYIAGTTDFSINPEAPFDLGSDLLLVAGAASPAERATRAAMRAAGVPAGASVTFVGHSQGAMVGARIAQSGDYDVHHLIDFGGPVRQMDLPASTRLLAIEHEQDLVPATGGLPRPASDQPGTVVVTRSLSAEELARTDSGVVPAHSLQNYRSTAALVDESRDTRIEGLRSDLFSRFAASSSAPITYYAVSRTEVGGAAPSPVTTSSGADACPADAPATPPPPLEPFTR